jgi:hypothetical protein
LWAFFEGVAEKMGVLVRFLGGEFVVIGWWMVVTKCWNFWGRKIRHGFEIFLWKFLPPASARCFGLRLPAVPLAVFAVEEVADGLSSGLIGFGLRFAFVGVHAALRHRVDGFVGDAALGTAIGEAGFIGLQFELFGTDRANFDWERHTGSLLMEAIRWSDAAGCQRRIVQFEDG